MITHDFPVDSPDSLTPQQQHTILRQLRQELITRYRPTLQQGSGPIRVMARLVHELESRCRELHIAPEIMRSEIMNRTIGDVNLRLITECEGEPGGPGDYRMLAEEIGIALPGEEFQGYTAPGATYLWLREQMQQIERELLQQGCDLRIYDLQALGNPVLRATLAEYVRPWGISASIEQVFPGLGALDSIDKTLRGLACVSRETQQVPMGMLCPEPGFGTPEWQATSFGYTLHCFPTSASTYFKLTPQDLDQQLRQFPDIRVLYLTVASNPTTFAYTPDDLNALYDVLRPYWQAGREILILTDLA